jgi:hypothetical protein
MNDLRGAFRVLQVVQTVKSDTFSTTSTSYTDITGFSATITPSATSSKILVMVDYVLNCLQAGGVTFFYAQLVRDSTAIYIGDTAGSRERVTHGGSNINSMFRTPISFLDSPNTTSATTYKMQVKKKDYTGAVFLNRQDSGDADNNSNIRTASSITVMEISA